MSQNYNSATVLALTGKDCVVICGTTTYNNELKFLTRNHTNLYKITPQLFVGFSGIYSDGQSIHKRLTNETDAYLLEHNQEIGTSQFSTMLSKFLYNKRTSPYMVGPVVVGFDKETPVIYCMDLIGATSQEFNFASSGSACQQLLGTCEAFYEKDLNSEELLNLAKLIFLKAVDRDCMSGGLEAVLIEKNKTRKFKFEVRQD